MNGRGSAADGTGVPGDGPALLALAPPWLVAIPLTAVLRLVPDEDGQAGREPDLGMRPLGGIHRRCWDLGRLLGARPATGTWIALAGEPHQALRCQRCLAVTTRRPAAIPVPSALVRGSGIAVIPAVQLLGGRPLPPGINPIALAVDPGHLLAGRPAPPPWDPTGVQPPGPDPDLATLEPGP